MASPSPVLGAVAVAVGGGAGSLLRYALARAFASVAPGFLGGVSIGTLVANFGGALLLGALTVWLNHTDARPMLKLLLTTGLCGGFTTYSTFNQESLQLLERGQLAAGAAYVGLTLLACLVGGAVGYFGLRALLA